MNMILFHMKQNHIHVLVKSAINVVSFFAGNSSLSA